MSVLAAVLPAVLPAVLAAVLPAVLPTVLPVVLLAVLAVLVGLFVLLLIAMSFPVHVRLRGVFDGGQVLYTVLFRPPLFPWYFGIPGLSRLKERRAGRESAGTALSQRKTSGLGDPGEPRDDAGESGTGPAGGVERLRTLAGSIRTAMSRLEESRPGVQSALALALRAVTVDEMHLLAKVGTGDAYETALLVGGLKAAIGMAVSIAGRKGVVFRKRPKVSLLPVYECACARVEVTVSLSIVLWRGVAAAASLYRRFKEKPSKWNTKA